MSTPTPHERLHSLHTVSERLGISIRTVRRLIASGALSYHRIGRLIRISQKDLDQYLRSQRN